MLDCWITYSWIITMAVIETKHSSDCENLKLWSSLLIRKKSHFSFVNSNKGSMRRAATMVALILSLHSTCKARRLKRLWLNWSFWGFFFFLIKHNWWRISWLVQTFLLHCTEVELWTEMIISTLLSVQTNRIIPSQAHQLLYERLEINCVLSRRQWSSKFVNFIVTIVTVWDKVWEAY